LRLAPVFSVCALAVRLVCWRFRWNGGKVDRKRRRAVTMSARLSHSFRRRHCARSLTLSARSLVKQKGRGLGGEWNGMDRKAKNERKRVDAQRHPSKRKKEKGDCPPGLPPCAPLFRPTDARFSSFSRPGSRLDWSSFIFLHLHLHFHLSCWQTDSRVHPPSWQTTANSTCPHQQNSP